jgi:tetratricopeptide (TPR) repeat protein
MSFALQLRLIPAPATLPVRAGYLPGSDVAAWLAEMARHPGAHFFNVPASVDQAEAGGLLILLGQDVGAGGGFGPRVLPCILEHGRVAVPATTRLDPQLTPEEARRLLPYHLSFFHPAVGLISFEETDAIQPAQLIVPPLPRAGHWMAAMPGISPLPLLRHVSLMLPEDPAGLFGPASDDIGSASPKDLLGQDPPLTRIKTAITGGAAAVGAGILGGLASLLGSSKAGGKSGGQSQGKVRGFPMMDQLARWTQNQLEKLQQQRESEIRRLIELLEKDPEKGLRYALPFGGGGDAARGSAPPSGRLGERDPIFGRSGRGGAADVWNFSDQSRFALQKRYRDLANREIAEGRFDRAAYIFAELLGDWHSAAGALARGKRFQEAARIYKDRLNNKPLAAKCLEDGGLLQDAILIYSELGQHEKCGDLYRRLGREREAIAAFNQALKGDGDRLHDARILFDKLEQHGLAIAVLASGYPGSKQAGQCLEQHFNYLARLQAHEDALALARTLAEPSRQLTAPLSMVQVLDNIQQSYPAPAVQARLAQVAISAIGQALAGSSTTSHPALLDLLPRFAPGDRLLHRDAGRFQDGLRRQQRRLVPPSSSGDGPIMMMKSSLRLPTGGRTWSGLVSRSSIWLATGYHTNTGLDVWAAGNLNIILGQLTSAAGWESRLPLPAVIPALPQAMWLPFAEKGKEPRYGQTQASDFSFIPATRQLLLDRLQWMPTGVHAVCPVINGAWILHRNVTETVDLSFYNDQEILVRTHVLGWAPPAFDGPIFMAVQAENVFIATGELLLQVKHGEIVKELELAGPVSALAVTQAAQPAAMLFVAGQEAAVMTQDGETIQLCNGDDIHACFLADGRIAVCNNQHLLLYSAAPHIRLLGSRPLPLRPDQSVSALAAWGERNLGILWTDGLIECCN